MEFADIKLSAEVMFREPISNLNEVVTLKYSFNAHSQGLLFVNVHELGYQLWNSSTNLRKRKIYELGIRHL